MRRATFLDRDGVLIASDVRDGRPHPVEEPEDVRVLPGVEEACGLLVDAGLVLVVVTNQPDVARGTAARADVEAINDMLRRRLPLHDVRTCFHDDDDGCCCRKPLPGMLVDAARDHAIDLTRSVMVGDRSKDIEAGRAAGCGTVLVDGGHSEPVSAVPDLRVASLREAVGWIVAYH